MAKSGIAFTSSAGGSGGSRQCTTSLGAGGAGESRVAFKEDASDVAGLVVTHEEAGVVFDFLFGKNEAIRGRIPWDSFVFVELEESGGVLELAAFLVAAGGLDFAQGS